MDIQYRSHGKQVCEPGYVWGGGLNEHLMIFVHEGKGECQAGGRTFRLGRGQGIVVFERAACLLRADEREPWTYSWLAFAGHEAAGVLRQAGMSADEPIFRFSPASWFDSYLKRLDEAGGNAHAPGLLRQSVLLRALADWFGLLAATPRLSGLRAKETYIQTAIDYIHAHYGRKLTVTELASKVGIDRVYLSTLFKHSLRVSPQQYMLRHRMDTARELLADPRFSVADVSQAVGYADPLLFSKMFKRIVGCSPTAYRILAAEQAPTGD